MALGTSGGRGGGVRHRGPSCIEEWSGPAGRKRTSYGAERVALASLRLTNLVTEGPVYGEGGALPRVVILTDSMGHVWKRFVQPMHPGRGTGPGDAACALNALAGVAEVLIRHVKAHHGIDLNEAADRLAEIGHFFLIFD